MVQVPVLRAIIMIILDINTINTIFAFIFF